MGPRAVSLVLFHSIAWESPAGPHHNPVPIDFGYDGSGGDREASPIAVASWEARRIFRASISTLLARPIPTAASFRIVRSRSTRCRGVRRLESLIRPTHSGRGPSNQEEGRTTAAATTGPQRAPRPASSTPAISFRPAPRCRRSISKSGKEGITGFRAAWPLCPSGRAGSTASPDGPGRF
jgi:hypothetical protein